MIMNQAVFVRANVLDGGNSRVVYLLVASDIYEPLKPYLERWMDDVEKEGYQTKLKVITNETPEQIRRILRETPNIAGCLIVGNVGIVRYEMNEAWEDKTRHVHFPIDLYYMDLDGEWRDNDRDEILDYHGGDKLPEIWVGRLIMRGKTREKEIQFLKAYFNRNHLYRIGAYTLPNRALIYIDSDMWEEEDIPYMISEGELIKSVLFRSKLFKEQELITDPVTTCAEHYLNKLKIGWSLVHVSVHGNSNGQHFKVNCEWEEDYVSSKEIWDLNPKAYFFVLYSCHNARYTESNYIGGCYVFSNYGLLAIGSTKAGAIWDYRGLYRSLGYPFYWNFGDAFLKIVREFVYRANPKYYYGMVLIGDPLLKPTDNGPDSDGDCLADWFEVENGLDPSNPDCDGDGLDDYMELVIYETNPLKVDSDDDGLSDSAEAELGTNPLDSDTDDDGLSDGEEVQLGTEVNNSDSDYDGLSDGEEVQMGTDPLDLDTDDDGFLDKKEIELELDPTDPDMDDDGLNDCQEILSNLDPKNPDTDGDFWNDKVDPAPTLPIIPNLFILALILVVVAVFLIKG